VYINHRSHENTHRWLWENDFLPSFLSNFHPPNSYVLLMWIYCNLYILSPENLFVTHTILLIYLNIFGLLQILQHNKFGSVLKCIKLISVWRSFNWSVECLLDFAYISSWTVNYRRMTVTRLPASRDLSSLYRLELCTVQLTTELWFHISHWYVSLAILSNLTEFILSKLAVKPSNNLINFQTPFCGIITIWRV
jgi:hypothetical protein